MESFGRFQILERLGVGGMGEVFRAKASGAQGFQKDIALKVILPHLSDEAEFETMFIDEAKTAVRLQHANIVQILDLGDVDGRYFIAMEYVDGRDLSRILKAARKRGTPMPMPLGLFIGTEILKGLDYAHKARGEDGRHLELVHRDISPQNVLVSFTGEVKVTDFGIALVSQRTQSKTEAGMVKGKFAYMPPEQIEGHEVGPWTDVFSAGLVMHTILTGAHPLSGQSEMQMVEVFRKGEIPPVSELNENIPPVIDPILQKALEPDPKKRYRSAAAFLEALEELMLNNRIRTGGRFLSEYLVDLFREELVAQARKDGKAPEAPTSRTPSKPSAAGRSPASKSSPVSKIPALAPLPPEERTSLAKHDSKAAKAPVPAAPEPEPTHTQPRPEHEWSDATMPADAIPAREIPVDPLGERVERASNPPRPVRWAVPIGAALLLIASAAVAGTFTAGGEPAHAGRPSDAPHGWIDFDPHPWADCTLDGKPIGATPLAGQTVSPGPHLLEWTSPDGRSGKIEFEAKAGRSLSLR